MIVPGMLVCSRCVYVYCVESFAHIECYSDCSRPLLRCHMCGIMLVLRAVFNMLVRNASPRGPMCFRCLMFNFSGPCELLFLLCFIAPCT